MPTDALFAFGMLKLTSLIMNFSFQGYYERWHSEARIGGGDRTSRIATQGGILCTGLLAAASGCGRALALTYPHSRRHRNSVGTGDGFIGGARGWMRSRSIRPKAREDGG